MLFRSVVVAVVVVAVVVVVVVVAVVVVVVVVVTIDAVLFVVAVALASLAPVPAPAKTATPIITSIITTILLVTIDVLLLLRFAYGTIFARLKLSCKPDTFELCCCPGIPFTWMSQLSMILVDVNSSGKSYHSCFIYSWFNINSSYPTILGFDTSVKLDHSTIFVGKPKLQIGRAHEIGRAHV